MKNYFNKYGANKMLGGQNPSETAFDNLVTQLYRSLGGFRVIDLANATFEDPLINRLSQALKQLREERSLEKLQTLEECVTACKAERKPLSYKEINTAISTFRSTLEGQTNGSRPSRRL